MSRGTQDCSRVERDDSEARRSLAGFYPTKIGFFAKLFGFVGFCPIWQGLFGAFVQIQAPHWIKSTLDNGFRVFRSLDWTKSNVSSLRRIGPLPPSPKLPQNAFARGKNVNVRMMQKNRTCSRHGACMRYGSRNRITSDKRRTVGTLVVPANRAGIAILGSFLA